LKNQVTYGRDQREYAKAKGLTLFVVGYDGRPSGNGGSFVETGSMEHSKASVLVLFGHYLADGLEPQEALGKAMARLAVNPAGKKARRRKAGAA
jgi:hypothetical protein